MRSLVFTNMFPFDAMPFYGSFVSDEVDALRQAGVIVDVLFINGKQSKLNYFASPWQLKTKMSERPYDIIHVHHSFCGFVANWQREVPVVWTFHEGEIAGSEKDKREEDMNKRIAHSKRFKRHVAKDVDSVIVVADYLKEPLGRMDAETIPSGVDTFLFKPQDRAAAREALGLDDEATYVLFPSAPTRPGKRFALAEATVAQVDGASLIALDDVPHAKVPLYMNAADVMLMTSAFEASPVTVREALACDLPVVSTAVGDVPLLAQQIEGCTSVDSDDPAVLAAAVADALAAGHVVDGAWVRDEYSLQRTAEKIMSVYERVIDKRKASQR